MTKTGKTRRTTLKHWRSVKDGTYIEERGLRRIELHTEKPTGKKSIIDSEDPLDTARVLTRAAKRIFEEANEKTLDQVLSEAAATTGAGTDPLMVDAEAIANWFAGIMNRYGALSPISPAVPRRRPAADRPAGSSAHSSTRHSVKGTGRRIGQRGVNSWRAGSPPRDSRSQIVRRQPVARAEGARSLPEGPGAACRPGSHLRRLGRARRAQRQHRQRRTAGGGARDRACRSLQAHPALSRIAQLDQTDCPPGPMSALGGSGRATPKEEVRV